jgi:amino acid transporter
MIVAISYGQVIRAYPDGGGAYTVASQNLGRVPGLIAAAALLIDYLLTVAVSVTSGIENFTSAVEVLRPYRIWLSVGAILVLTWLNLRGARESARVIAVPVYIFIFSCAGLIVLGIVRVATGQHADLPPPEHVPEATHMLGAFLVLRAFASGCAALTGIEAVSNGVQAFREPRVRNARLTLIILAALLGSFLLGITFLSHYFKVVPEEPSPGAETVLSQVARCVYGTGPMYYVLQTSTLFILLLAANTCYQDFPRVARLLARDGYLPRQLSNLGDRLVFSNGILILGALAIGLVFAFKGSAHLLIPLYTIGVFLSFTLSQSGMCRRWWKTRPKGWLLPAGLNGVGAILTAVVLCVVAIAKFTQGAWITAIAIPALIVVYLRIRRHYDSVAEQLSLSDTPAPVHEHTHLVVVPVASLHRGTLEAIEYARSFGVPAQAVHVISDDAAWQALQEKWKEWEPEIPLIGLPSPYRSLVDPVVQYVREQREKYGRVSVVIPEFVVSHWWEELLHNQSAIQLDLALRRIMHVSVVNFRYQLKT